MGCFVGSVIMLLAKRIEGGNEECTIHSSGLELPGEFRGVLADPEHERITPKPHMVVRCLVGLDFFLRYFRRRHVQSLFNSRVDAPRFVALAGRISFRTPPCPGRQVGLGVDPIVMHGQSH